jgi:hypothetical protein
MSPPRTNILDEDMHHRVFGPFFDVVALEQEGMSPKAQLRKSFSERIGLETDRLIKAQTRLEFLCGKEGAKRANFRYKTPDAVQCGPPCNCVSLQKAE